MVGAEPVAEGRGPHVTAAREDDEGAAGPDQRPCARTGPHGGHGLGEGFAPGPTRAVQVEHARQFGSLTPVGAGPARAVRGQVDTGERGVVRTDARVLSGPPRRLHHGGPVRRQRQAGQPGQYTGFGFRPRRYRGRGTKDDDSADVHSWVPLYVLGTGLVTEDQGKMTLRKARLGARVDVREVR